MPKVLIATDSTALSNEVKAVFSAEEFEVEVVENGPAALNAVKTTLVDLVVLDLQIANMGGVAICLDLRLESSAQRLPSIPVLLLLDRRADVFLARRAGAQGWLVKPLDPIRLRKATRALLDGKTYEDPSFSPDPIVVTSE